MYYKILEDNKMDKEKSINNVSVPTYVNKTLENILDSPSKSIGETLSDIWYITFGGKISFKANKKKIEYEAMLEKFKNEIIAEIENIPAEKLLDANINNVGLALENAKYCVEIAELRQMMAKLIGSFVNEDKAMYAHRGFSEIIKNLSPDEARVLKYLSEKLDENGNRFHCFKVRYVDKEYIDYNGYLYCKKVQKNEIKTCMVKSDKNSVGKTLYKNYCLIGYDAKCIYPDEIVSALDNLERLGIIEVVARKIDNNEEYEKIFKSQHLDRLLMKFHELYAVNEDISLHFLFYKHYFCLTNMGINLVETCFCPKR